MILNQGPTPLYYQIKSILKSRILSNELKGNQRLPSESELCIQYNVSRATVRQAQVLHVRAEDGGVSRLVADLTGAQRRLKYVPQVDLEMGLKFLLERDPQFADS